MLVTFIGGESRTLRDLDKHGSNQVRFHGGTYTVGVWRKVMENRGITQNIKYISCFGTLVLHCKNSLSLLCDTRSTTLTNSLRYGCDNVSTKDNIAGT